MKYFIHVINISELIIINNSSYISSISTKYKLVEIPEFFFILKLF